MKKSSDVVTYMWSKNDRRLIDRIISMSMVAKWIHVYDSIDIEDEGGVPVGAFYFVSGPRWFVRFLSKASDWYPREKLRTGKKVRLTTTPEKGFGNIECVD